MIVGGRVVHFAFIHLPTCWQVPDLLGVWCRSCNRRRKVLPIFGEDGPMERKWVKIPDFEFEDMDVSKNRGTPKWMVYNGKPY